MQKSSGFGKLGKTIAAPLRPNSKQSISYEHPPQTTYTLDLMLNPEKET